nr:T9SS type A sorting domain-containing protein [uncultured Flavobacterium sp.]
MERKITFWLLALLFAVGTNSYSNIGHDKKSTMNLNRDIISLDNPKSSPSSDLIGYISVQTIVPTLEVIQPTCAHPVGMITVTSPTGSGYEYSINNSPFQTNPVFSELVPAIYCIRVKDTQGTLYETVCAEIIKIIRPKTPAVLVNQPNCGTATGTIVVTDPIGSQYTYSVNGVDYQSSPVFSGLTANSYEVTVKNEHDCISKFTLATVNQPPKNCTSAGIFHTSVSCRNYQDDPGGQLIDQLCYRTRSGSVTNVTPGKFYYYTFLTAPSENFCVDILQTKSSNELAFFTIHQENQVTLYDADCDNAADGTQISIGQGRICISDAVPGAQYVLVVKYDSKSLIGSTHTGSAPIVQYIFESSIDGIPLPNSTASILMMPNCASKLENSSSDALQVTLAPNPASGEFVLHLGSVSKENITINITDINGRAMKQLQADYSENIRLGSELSAGLYFIEVIQGEKHTVIRALKL